MFARIAWLLFAVVIGVISLSTGYLSAATISWLEEHRLLNTVAFAITATVLTCFFLLKYKPWQRLRRQSV